MKKAMSIFGIIIISICCLSGCGKSEYKPRADEIYYKFRGNYRLISLVSKEPVIIENLALYNHTPIMDPVLGTVTMEIKDKFAKNSVFFTYDVEIEGALKILSLLHCNTDNLSKNFFSCGNIPLFTLNNRIAIEPYPYTIVLTDKLKYTVYGEIAKTAKVYTFNYTDRSPQDGSVVEDGSFKVYVGEDIFFDEFVIRQ